MAQWERARLEAEARLSLDSKNKLQQVPSNVKPKKQLLGSRPMCLDILKAWQAESFIDLPVSFSSME
ncbi:hypothetical protein COLO4_27996 [Corchorus olitorius]|uniref:Uncharacterized protein n=1 Tax=Corchorus olitorius TaxID=93759 RepID=A0A1R3HNI4_9ROSI|nr:hypothetical protein COLO4_27996 [Corchorus olitorius]